MAKLEKSTKPKLMNGFGEIFDYKDTELEQLAVEQIHQKRLNLEREITKHKVQKKLEQNNFYKFKNTAKVMYNSKKTEVKLKHKSNKEIIVDNLKNCTSQIPFEQFISKKIKLLEKEIKQHIKDSIKSLKLIQYSDESDAQLAKKTHEYKSKAWLIENELKTYQLFLKELLIAIQQPNFNVDNLLSYNTVQKTIEPILNNVKFDEDLNPDTVISIKLYCEKEFSKLVKAYKSQPYFKYKGHEEELTNKLEELDENYKKEKKAVKLNYRNEVKSERQRIKDKYRNSVNNSKEEFYKQRIRARRDEYENQSDLLAKEIKRRAKIRKEEIKKIKAQEKAVYKSNVKKYKSNVNKHFKLWSSKEKAIIESSDTTNLRLLLSPSLHSLNRWAYNNILDNLKANYLDVLGQRLYDLTWDGEFMINNATALRDYANAKLQNDRYFVEAVNANKQLIKPSRKMTVEDKQIYNNQASALKAQYDKDLQNLKNKLSRKEITREAYKLSKLKLSIFLEEDLKAIKMNLNSSKEKYVSKDILVTYKKQSKLIKKNLQQDKNKISKETPIEYKKNNSIWMTILAFLLPGVDSLVLKNWKKSIFFLIITALVWAIFVPYAFGMYNIKGEGIFGLIKLSWPTGVESPVYGDVWSDSRYALVEGVISVLLLVLSFAYLSISAYQCWKITRAMEKGIRYNTWVETKKILRSSGFPYAISIPGLILIIFIVIMPIIVSLLLAFTNIGTKHNPAGGNETNWVGFEQFIKLFTNEEFFKPFGNVLWWNIVWAISTTLLVLFIGTIMALAVENRNIKCKALWRTIFILPWAIPAFLSILFFKIIFGDSSSSLINTWLIDMGMDPINWQSDATMARLILILIQGWLGHSYIVLLVSGNMKSISGDIYEAAQIDKAKPFKQFAKMTLPIVMLQIAPLLISQFTFNFNNFSIIWMFNDGGSKIDPSYVYDVGNNDIILSWIFKITFGSQASNVESNQALGSALVIVMSIFVVGASGIGFARSKAFRKGEEV